MGPSFLCFHPPSLPPSLLSLKWSHTEELEVLQTQHFSFKLLIFSPVLLSIGVYNIRPQGLLKHTLLGPTPSGSAKYEAGFACNNFPSDAAAAGPGSTR